MAREMLASAAPDTQRVALDTLREAFTGDEGSACMPPRSRLNTDCFLQGRLPSGSTVGHKSTMPTTQVKLQQPCSGTAHWPCATACCLPSWPACADGSRSWQRAALWWRLRCRVWPPFPAPQVRCSWLRAQALQCSMCMQHVEIEISATECQLCEISLHARLLVVLIENTDVHAQKRTSAFATACSSPARPRSCATS